MPKRRSSALTALQWFPSAYGGMTVMYELYGVFLIFASLVNRKKFDKVEYVIFDMVFNWTCYLWKTFNMSNRKTNNKIKKITSISCICINENNVKWICENFKALVDAFLATLWNFQWTFFQNIFGKILLNSFKSPGKHA